MTVTPFTPFLTLGNVWPFLNILNACSSSKISSPKKKQKQKKKEQDNIMPSMVKIWLTSSEDKKYLTYISHPIKSIFSASSLSNPATTHPICPGNFHEFLVTRSWSKFLFTHVLPTQILLQPWGFVATKGRWQNIKKVFHYSSILVQHTYIWHKYLDYTNMSCI